MLAFFRPFLQEGAGQGRPVSIYSGVVIDGILRDRPDLDVIADGLDCDLGPGLDPDFIAFLFGDHDLALG
jgi:hypothetical protein